MLKGIIFDMDGVLVDSHPAHKQAWRAFLREMGQNCSEERLEFVLDGRTRRDILVHFLGDLTEDEIRTFSKMKDAHFASYADEVRLVPGVVEFLALLSEARTPCAVATSASHVRASETLDRFRLKDNFCCMVTASDVDCGKPDPAIFKLAGHRLGVEPNATVVFEDAVSGVQAATAAGCACIGIGSGSLAERLLRAGAVCVCPDFVGLSVCYVQEQLRLVASQSSRPLALA